MTKYTEDVTDDQFEAKVLESGRVVLVDFWAPWCGPCKAIAPFLEKIAEGFQGDLDVLKLNVDENPKYSAAFGVRSIPTLILFRSGEIVKEMAGAPNPQALVDLLEKTLEEDTPHD